MKIWRGYASEHSMNLVMIGRFKSVSDAEAAVELLERLTEAVRKEDEQRPQPAKPGGFRRFSAAVSKILHEAGEYSVGVEELEQLAYYDTRVGKKGAELTVRTDEADISIFVKLMLSRGARLELFSAHDYPEKEEAKPVSEGDDNNAAG